MAEYQEVMTQKRRMCNSYALCNMGCPLNNIDFCNKNSGEKINADFPEVERIVMSWAAEHPEPKYPTFGEWLEKQGIVKLVNGDRYEEDGRKVYMLLESVENQIPADIAEKLEIEPKR